MKKDKYFKVLKYFQQQMKTEKPRLPKSQLKWHLTDKFYEIAGWVLLLAIWGYIFFRFPLLPDVIPTHFSIDGTPDGYSNKKMVFLLPAIITILYAALTILNKYPHKYVYMVTITPLNARRNYQSATRKVRFFKFLLVILFGFICFQSIQVALGKSEGLGVWLLPFTFIVFFLLTVVTLFGALRHTKLDEN